jgi:hypothetical protein
MANFRFDTEWLVKLRDEGSTDVHTVVVYRVKRLLDDEGEPIDVSRAWVVGRGYEGGGVYGAHSAVVDWDDTSLEPSSVISSHHEWPEAEDFEHAVSDADLTVLKDLWSMMDGTLVDYGADDDRFVSRVPVPPGADAVTSAGWDPDDLIEVDSGWQFRLEF